jgi:uncharacterized protein YdeI (YjbR/CyaY-like superfamily)
MEIAGLKVELKKDSKPLPLDLEDKFNQTLNSREAFYALTSGRQRAYLLFFNTAKQAKTRETRVEKYISLILKGIGFNDCTCAMSKKCLIVMVPIKFLKQT